MIECHHGTRSCDHNRCGNLDEQLTSVRSNLETAESLVKEKDDELKVSDPVSVFMLRTGNYPYIQFPFTNSMTFHD